MRLHIIRHGDPDYANDTITELGHREAAACAERMAGLGITHLYSSPMGRAQATARYTAERIGMEPTILDWTAELHLPRITDLDGEPTAPWNIAGEIARQTGTAPTDEAWHELTEFEGIDLQGRQAELTAGSDEFLAGLGYRRNGGVYEIDGPDEMVVAVFCHAGFGVSWLAHLLGLPVTLAWAGFYWAPTSVTSILMERRSPHRAVPRALAVADTSHILAAGLPQNTRGLPANTA